MQTIKDEDNRTDYIWPKKTTFIAWFLTDNIQTVQSVTIGNRRLSPARLLKCVDIRQVSDKTKSVLFSSGGSFFNNGLLSCAGDGLHANIFIYDFKPNR